MTLEQKPGAARKFTPAVLPWIVAAAAFALFVATLNRWVSLANVAQVAKVAGWTWLPDLYDPAYFLVTYPFHWLPARWIPPTLNLFSAACAAGTLGLLARCVAILPHDRTREQREREKSESSTLSIWAAWVPPVLAALACGLQQTFWEHATNGTGEMFHLLLFAFVMWSLLEYRLDGRESRLTRAAFVWGAGMASNFAMIGFFPAFIAALVWIRGLSFFNLRFLGRMALFGCAGLLLYLLLPLADTLSQTVHVGFWQALKLNLVLQRSELLGVPFNTYALFHSDNPLWTMALTSLLPVAILSIKWPSYFGDTSRLGISLTTLIFHIMSGLFLIACLWVAFDPPFSPRHKDFNLPFLPFYCLGALSVGYFSGYFLLIFGSRVGQPGRHEWLMRLVNRVVTLLVWLLAVVVPVGLVHKNLPQIQASNNVICNQFAALLGQSLPPSGAVLLSDDPRRLLLAQAEVVRRGKEDDYLLLDTQSLKWPQYHVFLHAKHPRRWAETVDKNQNTFVPPARLVQLLVNLSTNSPLYYLHPSFGYYFEFFSLEPHGLAYKLNPYPTNALFPPPLTKEMIDENQAFWARANDEAFKPLLPLISPPSLAKSRGPIDRFLDALHLTRDPNSDAVIVGTFYSRGLDYWAVELQRGGNFEAAAVHFDQALQLNPDNVAAQINQKFNIDLRAGRKATLQSIKSMEDQFGKSRDWAQVLGANGPFDEPSFCYGQGGKFIQGGLYRQAAVLFARVRALVPDDPYALYAQLWLAQLHIMARQPDEALAVVKEIRARPDAFPQVLTNQTELVSIEASAHLARNDFQSAEQVLETALEKFPRDDNLLSAAVQIYTTRGYFTNALTALNRRLKTVPDEPASLLRKGCVYLQVNAFDEAISTFTHLLDLQPTNEVARLDRAIACLRSDKLDAARQDYEALLKLYPTAYPIHFGLAEIASRNKDTNTAVKHYEQYLANGNTNSPESKFVSQRLKELKGGTH